MLIDTNILIYALSERSPKKEVAQNFLQQQKRLVLAQQNLFETIRVMTHPKFPKSQKPESIIKSLRQITKHATIIYPTLDTTTIAYSLIAKHNISGTEVFDAYLVATALSNGVTTLATDNIKHLGKYVEVKTINPFKL